MKNGQRAEFRGDKVTVTGNCLVTGEEYSVTVPRHGYLRWRNGTLAQDAFPTVSLNDREFLISGTSPRGWEEMFGGEEAA